MRKIARLFWPIPTWSHWKKNSFICCMTCLKANTNSVLAPKGKQLSLWSSKGGWAGELLLPPLTQQNGDSFAPRAQMATSPAAWLGEIPCVLRVNGSVWHWQSLLPLNDGKHNKKEEREKGMLLNSDFPSSPSIWSELSYWTHLVLSGKSLTHKYVQ